MKRMYFAIIVCLAAASIVLIFFSLWKEARPPATAQEQPFAHPIPPFESYISGVGIVEASSENIFIGLPISRLVEKVFVTVNTPVKKGQPLLELENQDLEAELKARQAEYDIALARLKKLEALPRKEDILTAESALKSAQVALLQTRGQYDMTQQLQDKRAISQEESNRRLFAYQQAEAKWQEAQANLNKVKAGTWKPDLEIAKLQVQQAEANVERAKTSLKRTLIRSPIDGKVLLIQIHEGEFPPPDTFRNPIMVVGNTDEKHLEVSINQFNAPYFRPDAPAVAFLQGNPQMAFPLEFIHLEPYLVSKQNLTHDISEKVDTRVLQATYRLKKDAPPLFVGQLMDVFIETEQAP